MHTMYTHKQSGLTIVEVMVAMVIALVLLNGVVQIFLSSKQTYRFGEAVSRLQESGRVAIDTLSRDVRMAGYQGCADLSAIPANIIANNPPSVLYSQEAITGWEVGASAWSPSAPVAPADITSKARKYSDVVAILHASDLGVKLTGNMLSDNANIQIAANTPGFVANDVLIMSDCETVDIFRASNVSNGGGGVTIAHANNVNTTPKLSKPYGADATIYTLDYNLYFVGDTGRTNNRGQIIYALYKRDIKGVVSEVVEGVEFMQVLYGEKATNGNIRYVAASEAGLNMLNVVSVRIGLLLHSIEPINQTDDTATYNVLGTTIVPEGSGTIAHGKDKRIRRMFVTTIKLRNRR